MNKNESKPRWKLNIADIIIIAVIVIAAGALIFIWRGSGNSSRTVANTKPVHYSIELSGMIDGSAELIGVGDTIVDNEKKFVMGEVTSVVILPATTSESDYETGNTVEAEIPGEYTAIIEIVANCATDGHQITTESGYVVRVGTPIFAGGPGYAGTGYVVEINREEADA